MMKNIKNFPIGIFLLIFFSNCHKKNTTSTSTSNSTPVPKTNCKSALSSIIVKNFGTYQITDAAVALKPLNGHVIPESLTATALNEAPDNMVLSFTLVFELKNENILNQFLAEQQDPSHPNYGQKLETNEFTKRFHRSEDETKMVTQELQKNGIMVKKETPWAIKATANVAQINAFFHTEIWIFKPQIGENFYAPKYELMVPNFLPIENVLGLENRIKIRRHSTITSSSSTGSTSGSLVTLDPPGIKKAYQLASKLDGSGQSIGVISCGYDFVPKDINLYKQKYNLGNVRSSRSK